MVQEMGRPKTDVRISLKGKDGHTVRVGLIKSLGGGWFIYRDGKVSSRHPQASATKIGELVTLWLKSQG